MVGALYWTIVGGVMTIGGIMGNIISILVLRRKTMRSQNLNTFLLVQAVIDLGAVLSLLLRKWIDYTFNFDASDENDFMCKSLHFLSSSFVDISSWNLVLTSLEKLMFVIHPLTSHVNRSVRCRRIEMTVVFLILVVYNIPSLIGYGIGQKTTNITNNRTECNDDCQHNYNTGAYNNNKRNISDRNNKDGSNNNKDNTMYTFFHRENGQIDSVSGATLILETIPAKASKNIGKCTHVLESYTHFVEQYDNWIHIFVRIIVPAIIMMVCNIIIIKTISSRPILDEAESTNACRKKTGPSLWRRVPPNTKLVVFVNLLFFVTCAPVSINRIYDCLNLGYNTSDSYSYFRLLALTHHSVGFVFYMLNGQRFRKEFYIMCRELYAFGASSFGRSKKAFPSISFELSVSKA